MLAQQQTDSWQMIDRAERALNEAGMATIYATGFVADLEAMIREFTRRVATDDRTRIEELEEEIAELEDELGECRERLARPG